MDFSELQLIRPLLRAVEEAGYSSPSPIQQKAIPPVLAGRDLLGCAQTGTGKTAAFALPILQRLSRTQPAEKGIRALILTPTRELALQIDECFAAYGKYLKVSHTVIFGGVGQAPQVAALQKGVHVLTACPGRLNDLIGQGHVDLTPAGDLCAGRGQPDAGHGLRQRREKGASVTCRPSARTCCSAPPCPKRSSSWRQAS